MLSRLLRWLFGRPVADAGPSTASGATTPRSTATGERPRAATAPFDLLQHVGHDFPPEARAAPAAGSPEVAEWTERVRRRVQEGQVPLPGFPPLAAQIFRTIERPEFDMNQLVSLVRRDPVVAAQVLKVANSLRFVGTQPVESIRDAVVRLGVRETAQAVSSVSVQALFDVDARGRTGVVEAVARRLWQHAMASAYTASWASMTLRRGDADRTFLGGLLHDVGKSVALRALAGLQGEGDAALEPAVLHGVLEATHVELALDLSQEWQLPEGVRDLIRDLHEPAVAGDENLELVRLASALSERFSNPSHREDLAADVERSVAGLALTVPEQRALGTQLKESSRHAASLA